MHSQKEVAEEAEKYPKPVLWKRIDIGEFWPCGVRYGDFRGAGQKEIVLEKETDEGVRVVCLNFDGEVQYDRTFPAAKGLQRSVVHDLDGDGVEDFIGIEDDRLKLVSGKLGEVTAETELPRTGPYRGYRNASMGDVLHSLKVIWPCKIRKTEKAQDLILRDGDGAGTGYSIWAFDEKLNLRWRQDAHNAWYGMYIWFYDVDGDGRDEILPGYDLYDGDGNHLWTMEGRSTSRILAVQGILTTPLLGNWMGMRAMGQRSGLRGAIRDFSWWMREMAHCCDTTAMGMCRGFTRGILDPICRGWRCGWAIGGGLMGL